ncbi:MAG TPA: hypothetical protein VKG24_18060 [Pseudolabrys sp.]|nr:hypothetical protein [Pseudolabrys sp.]
MRREQEDRQLADNAHKHGCEEKSAILKAQWEFLAGNYMRLAERSKQRDRGDDEKVLGDPIPWDRQPRR